jgi:archaellum biogenesis ATPase FlaH
MGTMKLDFDKIPPSLKALDRWVLWRTEKRTPTDDKPTKVPYVSDGHRQASSTDATTFSDFAATATRFNAGGFDGIGFEFGVEHQGLCGVDLDGCRNPETGEVAQWARDIINALDTYAEVSPSKTGVKLFLKGKWTGQTHKAYIADAPKFCHRAGSIEVYDWGRYFAVTGWRLKGPTEPQDRQARLDSLRVMYWPEQHAMPKTDWESQPAIIERARKYMAHVPPAISGSSGHNNTFKVACALVLGFDLKPEQALPVMQEWNALCQPPWAEKDLRHKLDGANRQGGPRGYLLNQPIHRYASLPLVEYREPPRPKEIKRSTLRAFSEAYLDQRFAKGEALIDLGLPDLDYAIGGGVERGELVIVAARPSHGKSACGLQMVHHWSGQGKPSLFISEEMSGLALGKRTVLYASSVPEEHWNSSQVEVWRHVSEHFESRAPAWVIESCRSIDAACEAIRQFVKNDAVECVVVDYAQLLGAKGKSRYEQITNVSIGLRQVSTETGVVVVALCQLSRDIEKRKKFIPQMTDLKETGQLEQDADVIIFSVWPHRICQSEPANQYKFYIAKNRNRAINQRVFECRFEPSRQRLVEAAVEYETDDDAPLAGDYQQWR